MTTLVKDADIQVLSELTNNNQHTEARRLLSLLVKRMDLYDCYDSVSMLHDYFGHLPTGLSLVRNALDKALFDSVGEKCGDKADKIKKAF